MWLGSAGRRFRPCFASFAARKDSIDVTTRGPHRRGKYLSVLQSNYHKLSCSVLLSVRNVDGAPRSPNVTTLIFFRKYSKSGVWPSAATDGARHHAAERSQSSDGALSWWQRRTRSKRERSATSGLPARARRTLSEFRTFEKVNFPARLYRIDSAFPYRERVSRKIAKNFLSPEIRARRGGRIFARIL